MIQNKKITSYEKYTNFYINFRNLFNYFLEFNENYMRKCYACENNMSFLECYNNNKYKITIKNLIKIWTNNNVKLFCCNCNSILESFPKEIQEYLIENKEIIPKINYALIPDDYENNVFDGNYISKILIKDIKIEKIEEGYKTTVEVELDTGFTINIEEIFDKEL